MASYYGRPTFPGRSHRESIYLTLMTGITAIILLLLAPLAAEAGQPAATRATQRSAASQSSKRVLLVYDAGAAPQRPEDPAVDVVADLLGHFECNTTVLPADAYRAGELSGYDAMIYLGLREGAELPEQLLGDCYGSERAVCWIGANLDQLAEHFSLERYGFELVSDTAAARPKRVVYRGRRYRRMGTALTGIAVSAPDVCEVLAVAEGDGGALPYAVRSGRFWYVADLPLPGVEEGCSHLILCDQLHEILQERHAERKMALICVTGVSSERDMGSLVRMVSYFESAGVPFAISVIPVFRDPEAERGIRLSSRRGLVGVLRGAQAHGASVIAHGLSQQSSGVRGEKDRGVRQETAAAGSRGNVRERLDEALAELARCGLYPVAWVRPSGLASAEAAADVAKLCSTMWPRQEEDSGEPWMSPFLIREDRYGQCVIPNNLPALRQGRGEAEAMLAAARRETVVADAWVTASIDPNAPLSAVEVLVSGLREAGYGFADLRHMENWTKGRFLHVYSVAAPRPVRELVPDTWGATLTGAASGEGRLPGEARRFESPGKDGRENAQVRPGALLLAYPIGLRPRPILALEGGPEAATSRLVYSIAHVVVFFGVAACGLLMLIYLAQVMLQRRA